MINKLSKRLSFILKLAPSSGDAFYDLCCDHGQLGYAVAATCDYKEIFLIDQVKSIIDKISKNSLASDIPKSVAINYRCLDARKLKIDQNYKNVISIAGIGGELAIKMVENLLEQLKETDTLVISAHNNINKLRAYLIEKNLNLVDEGLIADNKKFYEVIVINKLALGTSNITTVFNPINEHSDSSDIDMYYEQQITYLETKLQFSKDPFYEEILKCYSASKSQLK